MKSVTCCNTVVSFVFQSRPRLSGYTAVSSGYYHSLCHSSRNLDEELIDRLVIVCTCGQRLSSSPFLCQEPVWGALSCCSGPALKGCICTATQSPRCSWRPMFGHVCPWQAFNQLLGQLLDRRGPDSRRSLRLESHQKVDGGGASECFDCRLCARRDSNSCVDVGLRVLLILFQKKMGERASDGGARRGVEVIGGRELSWATALRRVTGAARRGAAAASWSQALCSNYSSVKLLQERFAAWSVSCQQPNTHRAVSQKSTVLQRKIKSSSVEEQLNLSGVDWLCRWLNGICFTHSNKNQCNNVTLDSFTNYKYVPPKQLYLMIFLWDKSYGPQPENVHQTLLERRGELACITIWIISCLLHFFS